MRLKSTVGRLVTLLALATALAGAIGGGALLHDWMFAVPPPDLAAVAPTVSEPENSAPAEPAALPANQETAIAPAEPGHILPDVMPAPSTAPAMPSDSDPIADATAPLISAEPPAQLPADPAVAMALPFTEAGPESPAAVPTSEAAPVPALSMSTTWLRNAVPVAVPAGRPLIAIVIDDVGVSNPGNTDRVIALHGPLTLALMSYATNIVEMAASARAAGHELLVHVPMEPEDGHLSTGPNVMQADLPTEELRRRLQWALARFDGYVGVNNHMGSQFTTSDAGMTIVLEELRGRGLLFLDSKTTAASVGSMVANRLGVPFAERDVFLDNETSASAVEDQLKNLEAVARHKGYAIAIGHPHDGTLDALSAWLATVEQRGFVLVPVSWIVQRNLVRAAATN